MLTTSVSRRAALSGRTILHSRILLPSFMHTCPAVSAAEDPEKLLDQVVTEMQEDLIKMRQASAQVCARIRLQVCVEPFTATLRENCRCSCRTTVLAMESDSLSLLLLVLHRALFHNHAAMLYHSLLCVKEP